MQAYVYWRTAHGVTLACSFGGVGGTTGGGSQDTYIAEKIDLLTYTDEAPLRTRICTHAGRLIRTHINQHAYTNGATCAHADT